jgi:predicted Rossmann-fold nucleotide-binding protein
MYLTSHSSALITLALICWAFEGCTTVPACPTDSHVTNARYVGKYLGMENNLSPAAFYQDLYCANRFKSQRFPNGYVTVYGSSRIAENSGSQPNRELYQEIRHFAQNWTRQYGAQYPIMSGAGPGLMEAASRGAKEAGGPSVGYTTYYFPLNSQDSPPYTHPYAGDATTALNPFITDGLIFSSIAMREDLMILHSAAVVIAPGGTGTEWETFQILETLKSKQLIKVPVYFVGDEDEYWRRFEQRLCDMQTHGTLLLKELPHFEFVSNPVDVIGKLKLALIAGDLPQEAPVVDCK